ECHGWDGEETRETLNSWMEIADIISVGSGSPNAYAVGMAREAVFRATHWDIYSGNNVDLFHIAAHGWRRRDRVVLKEEYTERGRERRRR
uniref:Uncharacterized protein n=1 Tax=Cyprinus carpio carpio TaxID=630221 RepID=A0A9J7ZZY5_CYPCA